MALKLCLGDWYWLLAHLTVYTSICYKTKSKLAIDSQFTLVPNKNANFLLYVNTEGKSIFLSIGYIDHIYPHYNKTLVLCGYVLCFGSETTNCEGREILQGKLVGQRIC